MSYAQPKPHFPVEFHLLDFALFVRFDSNYFAPTFLGNLETATVMLNIRIPTQSTVIAKRF